MSFRGKNMTKGKIKGRKKNTKENRKQIKIWERRKEKELKFRHKRGMKAKRVRLNIVVPWKVKQYYFHRGERSFPKQNINILNKNIIILTLLFGVWV
jgi:hypothetical protein